MEEPPPAGPPEVTDTVYHSTLRDCPCTTARPDDNRLEMTISGKKLCFNRKRRPEYIFRDQWQTVMRSTIYIEWLNEDSTMMLRIQYNNPAFLKHGLPYTLNYLTQDSCELMGIHLFNFHPYRACKCELDDSWYYGYFFDPSINIEITSFHNNVLEARFYGDFITYTGKRRYKVTDGYIKTTLDVEKGKVPAR